MSQESILNRKKEHLEICSDDSAAFRRKTTGFEKYDFRHCAITEVEIDKIKLNRNFFGFSSTYPFLISCMTGGSDELNNINLKLAESANKLRIPLGLGSLRYALATSEYDNHLKLIRDKAGDIPVLGNIGAAQILDENRVKIVESLIRKSGADVFVIHLNPLQELLQKGGEFNFKGLLKSVRILTSEIETPIIVKEVGSGIDGITARKLAQAGVKGIDTAGAGGTSWAGVELIRNKAASDTEFWDWGMPTSDCIREINAIRKKYKFTLIGSGGINNAFDAAKALALGADFIASARVILQALNKSGSEGVTDLIHQWFETIKKIMYLTGTVYLDKFNKKVLIKI